MNTMTGICFFLVLFAVSVTCQEDDGKAFEVSWTDDMAKACTAMKDADNSGCEMLKAGDTIKIPDTESCATWAKKGRESAEYDFKAYCTSFRSACLILVSEEKADWAANQCSVSYARVWKQYNEEQD